jgi:hypothetical protein
MSKLPLLILTGGKRSSWFHRVAGLSTLIMLLVISLLYGLVIGTCRTTIPSWTYTPTPTPTPTPCPDPCDQAALNVRIADLTLEPAAPVQGCPLTVKWSSCYDEKDYDPKTIACTPVVPLTLPPPAETPQERVMIVDSKGATAAYQEIPDMIDLGCDPSRSYTWPEPTPGDYSVNVTLDLYGAATECDNQKVLGLADLNSDNTQGVQFTVGCPCRGHEYYDLSIADLQYDAATRHVQWTVCEAWAKCTDPAEEVTFDETIVVTRPGGGYSHTDVVTGAKVTMGGECPVRGYDIPASVDAGDYEISVSLTAQAPFADCDPYTATKNTACTQLKDLATNNSLSIKFTIK